jgi:hypothetical protein
LDFSHRREYLVSMTGLLLFKGGKMIEETLRDGTLVRHKVEGYEGYVEGITRIKELFTEGGQLLNEPRSKQIFQYRVVLEGESMRRIAPAEDMEILEEGVAVTRRKRLLKRPSSAGTAKGTNIMK